MRELTPYPPIPHDHLTGFHFHLKWKPRTSLSNMLWERCAHDACWSQETDVSPDWQILYAIEQLVDGHNTTHIPILDSPRSWRIYVCANTTQPCNIFFNWTCILILSINLLLLLQVRSVNALVCINCLMVDDAAPHNIVVSAQSNTVSLTRRAMGYTGCSCPPVKQIVRAGVSKQ